MSVKDVFVDLKNHLEKLQYFFEVAKLGSIKDASKTLHITQPSITKSIQHLEDVIGKTLFHRLPRGMRLNQEGELLLRYCYELFSGLNDLEIRLKSPEDPMAGSLKVGTYDSIAIYFWPKFFRSFITKFPKLELELTTGRSHMIQALVEKGEIDLGLIIEPVASLGTLSINLAVDYFQLYETTTIKPLYESAEEAPLIYMPDALAGNDHKRLEEVVGLKSGHSKRRIYKTSSLETAKELALNGLGLALLPKMVAKDALSSGDLKLIKSKGLGHAGIGKHRIGIVYSKHRENSLVLRKLISELKSVKW